MIEVSVIFGSTISIFEFFVFPTIIGLIVDIVTEFEKFLWKPNLCMRYNLNVLKTLQVEPVWY